MRTGRGNAPGEKIRKDWAMFSEFALILDPFPIPKQACLHLRGAEKEVLPLHTQEQDMVYEIRRFLALAQDPAQALRVMDQIRAQARIDFSEKPCG